jgi:hypothetical protein
VVSNIINRHSVISTNLLDYIVDRRFAKGFFKITVLSHFPFGYVYKDVADLQDIVQIRLAAQFSFSVQMSDNISKLTLHCATPVLYFCSRQSITQLQSGTVGANETFDPDLESFATFLKTNNRNICKSVPEASLEAQNNDADDYHLIWFDGWLIFDMVNSSTSWVVVVQSRCRTGKVG